MTIKDMHYDFKTKVNKVDSQQNENFLIPEIDWVLNEALELYIKMITQPRNKSNLGFEINQRSIDDIRTLVVRPESDPSACISVTANVVTLPIDYWYLIKGNVYSTKGNCIDKKCRLIIRQHDDDFEESAFDKSSFEWRQINGVFFENGIKLFDDGTFTNNQLCIDYIKKHPYIHNAQDFRTGTYNLPSGISLTGTQDCILPEHTHREIVDLAVLIVTGEFQGQDYQTKLQKLNFNQLK